MFPYNVKIVLIELLLNNVDFKFEYISKLPALMKKQTGNWAFMQIYIHF